MLEASVEMGLGRQEHYVLEVRVVDVGVDSEQTFEDDFDDGFEVSGEGNAKGTRENLLVIQLVFNPGH